MILSDLAQLSDADTLDAFSWSQPAGNHIGSLIGKRVHRTIEGAETNAITIIFDDGTALKSSYVDYGRDGRVMVNQLGVLRP